MTTLVVTGASGFIGRRLCTAAVAQGFDVIAIGHRQATPVAGARCLTWDEFLRSTFSMPAVCCHLGEQGNIATFNREGTRFTLESLNTIRSVIGKGFSRVVYASTGAVYPPCPARALSEADAVDPSSPYVRSKLDVEQAVTSVQGFNLRLANVYGPGMSAATVLPTLVSQLRGSEESVVVRCVTDERDFVYVDDVVRAFLAAVTTEAPSGTYNVSSGSRASIVQLFEMLMEIFGKQKALYATETRAGTSLALSAEKAGQLLGWHARMPLKDGLRLTFQEA